MNKAAYFPVLVLMILTTLFSACAPQLAGSDRADGLKVVATTTIVADVVAQVSGEQIALSVLLPVGADPHSFDPTPQDIAKAADADLVFASGAGLEAFLDTLLESAGASEKIVFVSEGIELGEFGAHSVEEEDEEHAGEAGDPHTWTDPNNVMVWVDNIEQALSTLDPDHKADYAANAAAYRAELEALDGWIHSQVAQIPVNDRLIVTDHTLLGYFAAEYGFTQVGALIPGYSTLAEPTAKELAEIEDAIRSLGVKAIFVGNSVNPTLAERVVEDTGIRLVYFYTGSLSDSGGEADTYLKYMRYNVNVIVDALKE